jgi:hypothetical protein
MYDRTEGNPPGNWTPWGSNIRLPSAALDPGTRDVTKVILPTSPNSPALKGAGTDKSPIRNNDKEKSDSWADDISDNDMVSDADMEGDKDGSIPPGAIRGRLKVFGTYPPSSQPEKTNDTGKDAPAFSGRSSLTLRTPHRINNEKEGSFGS